MIEAALQYAAAGLRVHPCRPEDKRPLTRWSRAATTEPAIIESWWQRWPDALLAVCTGDRLLPGRRAPAPDSRLVVVDIDPRSGGQMDDHLFNYTLTATTRSGGWHHWCWTYEPMGNRVGLLPGIDIRGIGGYVIAPPSPGWAFANDRPIQILPSPIATAMQYQRRAVGRGFEPASVDNPIGEGGRNNYMARFAGWVLRNELAESCADLVELCQEHNAHVCQPPLPGEEVSRTARSIWRLEQRG